MYIYIDESGVFVPANHPDAWCVVAAYVSIEKEIRSLTKLVTQLKLNCGKTFKDEVKLKDITEAQYMSFLRSLREFSGTLFCTATDMSLVSELTVMNHRNIQAQKVVEHKEKMIHRAAKISLEHLSAQIRELAPQLYMQLVCQVNLIADLINRAVLFYVQRRPNNLRRFK